MKAPLTVLLVDTTRWAGAARLVLALSNAGSSVSAICPARGHPLLKARSLRRTFVYSPLRPVESLAGAIEAINPSWVIPCDDRAVQHLHELHARALSRGASERHMAELIERSLGAPESYPIVSSRSELLKVAHQEGLRVAPTQALRTADDLLHWESTGTFPYVLKVDGTGGGYGVRIVQDLGEARRSLSDLEGLFRTSRVFKRLIVNRDAFWLRPWWNRSRPVVVAQSYIHGHPANCAVVCREGIVLAGIAVEVVSAAGPTEPATVVRLVDSPEMMQAAERLARRLRISGMFGLDFIIEKETGTPHLIEMNPRSTPLCHLRLDRSRDIVGALSTEPSAPLVGDLLALGKNALIAYFPQAWTTKSEWLKSSFQDIPSEEPDLVQELLNPWPERTRLVHSFNYLLHWTRKWKQRGASEMPSPTMPPAPSPTCTTTAGLSSLYDDHHFNPSHPPTFDGNTASKRLP